MIPSVQIRRQFIDFFVSHGHREVSSAPVIPSDDPTLLFTNAGMNQFKPIFLGLAPAKFPRVADSQKCIRAGGKHNDLEEVGRDGYHHTFFEMLGNWSFGDYYKKEAITWAWELITGVWRLPKDRLYATVHRDDHEARELWLSQTDIDPSHVEYHGDKDNFWEMGNTGPCGPCSEIHYDRGPEYCNRQGEPGHVCRVNGDCHRYIELWNLVFIQYNRIDDGSLEPLSAKYVDTGAGFERICQILQGVSSNYDTDLFTPIIAAIAELSGKPYDTGDAGVSHRVIADHVRCLSFALADGGMPSNEGRGYVLRRILRRAARHGRLLGMHEPFLCKLVSTVVRVMGDHYTELKDKQAHIELILRAEEERFNATLDQGLSRFDEIVARSEGATISGADAFLLYDTYGFPLDLTRTMAEERLLALDEAGFETEMEKQRQRARDASKFKLDLESFEWTEIAPDAPTEFAGYTESSVECRILRWGFEEDGAIRVVLDRTPFYAESGGQVADTGVISGPSCEIEITNVRKDQDRFIHIGHVRRGAPDNSPFTATINATHRLDIARNHTTTHLLHRALREVLGEHVQQKGSLVHPDYLRFDFTHFQQTTHDELLQVEERVNCWIRECHEVTVRSLPIDEAKKAGAMALFGEKYGEVVRMVSVEGVSRELCGGTHLFNTGQAGYCHIISESAIAAGIRRIEAVTGRGAELAIRESFRRWNELATTVGVPANSLTERVIRLIEENKQAAKDIDALRLQLAAGKLDAAINQAVEVNGVKLLALRMDAESTDDLRAVADTITGRLGSGIGVLAGRIGDKVSILVVVTKDLTSRFHAGKLCGEFAAYVGGKGGGRPDVAMAGGREIDKIDDMLKAVPGIIAAN
jgi:alanyl-tRNA synthetase